MIPARLLLELQKLNWVDKLRVVQILVNELALEEGAVLSLDTTYPVYTPYGNEAAADVLFDALQQARSQDR
jgi:hypothetical protein